MRNQAQVLLKRYCTLGKLVHTQIKGITLLCTEKIIFVSVAFLMALSIYLKVFHTLTSHITLLATFSENPPTIILISSSYEKCNVN